MLLSKALKMQQDSEDRRHEVIVKGLEDKIKELETSLKEKRHPAANSRKFPHRIPIPKY
jgi:hypothetical protein